MGTGAVEGANILINVENVTGTGRDDYLQGSDANEEFRGGAGNDILRGGGGVDTLHGGEGDDWLIGGDGDNILNGGAGVNTLKGDAGVDIIKDFKIGEDKIHIIGGIDNLSLEFIAADGSAEAHFLLKKGDNVLVKVETDATAFTAATVFDFAQFEFAADLAELATNLNYDFSGYDMSGLL